MSYYPDISTVNATQDLSQLLVYCNTVTNGLFGPLVAWAFFIIVLLGTFFAQMRLAGRPKLDICLLVAGFASVGFSVLMAMEFGLLSTFWVVVFIILAIVGAIFVYFSQPD